MSSVLLGELNWLENMVSAYIANIFMPAVFHISGQFNLPGWGGYYDFSKFVTIFMTNKSLGIYISYWSSEAFCILIKDQLAV